MVNRTALQFALACAAWTLLCPSPLRAQLPRRLEECLPYPTFAQEIKEMRDQTPEPQVIVDAVRFKASTPLPYSIQRELTRSLTGRQFAANSDWVDEIEQAARRAWSDRGYFFVNADAEAQLLGSNSTHQRVSVTIHVDEGRQYRLSSIRFSDNAVFRSEELLRLIHLRPGEVFNTQRIRDGLEALRNLYGSKGYIDFVAQPQTEADHVRRRISLVMDVAEGKQFRVGKIKVLGLDPGEEHLFLWKLRPGDLFNVQLLDDFYKDNKSILPADASPADMHLHRNLQDGTADLLFDFRTCASLED